MRQRHTDKRDEAAVCWGAAIREVYRRHNWASQGGYGEYMKSSIPSRQEDKRSEPLRMEKARKKRGVLFSRT